MRSGANSVQHLLTPAALGVLKHAVTEARRRGHPQVQPLHVVSMLLTHAGSRLRQACMLSHPQNAQTAECRALEVCFNVALDHLPQSAMAMNGGQHQPPPILSNALMAALKRAHAHQRRGCPEHQQSPLLAVKVEIDQLIISILDDPSVSRVMKEAGFSSTNVKFNLEDGSAATVTLATGAQSNHGALAEHHGVEILSQGASFYDASCVLSDENETKSPLKFASGVPSNSWPAHSDAASLEGREAMLRAKRGVVPAPAPPGVGLPTAKGEDVQNILEILLRPRSRNRNAILISDTPTTANATLEDLAVRIKNGTVPSQLQGLQFLDPKLSSSSFGYCSSLEMEQKLAELSKIVEECMPEGAILHIGDLQWLAEPKQLKKGPSNFCPAQRTAAEVRQLLGRHAGSRLWVVGVATAHVFASLQALYPNLISDWGLETVQIATVFQTSQNTFLQRFANNLQNGKDQSATLLRTGAPVVASPIQERDSNERFQCCGECLAKFEEERRLLHENENLSLQLAPVKWLSMSTDEASSGCAKEAMNQENSRSLAQQLSQLQQICQKTCRMLHGEPMPVLTPRAQQQQQQPRSLSRLSPSSLSKPGGLGVDISSPWSGPECRRQNHQLASPVVDPPLPSIPVFTAAREPRRVSPLQPVQEPKPVEAPELGSPKDGSSLTSSPEDHEDANGSSGTSAQDAASLTPIETNLALGRANDGLINKLREAPKSLNPSPLQQQSVGASPLSLKNGGKPLWMLQTSLPLRTSPFQSSSPLESSSPLQSASPLRASPLQSSSPLQSASPLRASPLQSSSPLQSASPLRDSPLQSSSPLQSASPLRASALQTSSPLQSSSPLRASPLQSSSPLQSASPLRASPLQSASSLRASPLQSASSLRASPLQSASPLQQRRSTHSPLQGGLGWQSSPLAKRHSLIQVRPKSPSPPPATIEAGTPFKEFTVDATLKGLYKGLMQRVPWQAAAVAGISATVMKCRSGMGSFRGATAKTDTWLLLLGPDPVAKKAIAKVLAELVFGGEMSLLHLGFGDGSPARLEVAENGMRYRGKTPIDRLVEAVRMKKSAVILLEDVDKANSIIRASLVRAMEIGKLADSNGREVSFGNTIVVMTTSIGSDMCGEPKARAGSLSLSEGKLAALGGRAKICGRVKDCMAGSEKVIFQSVEYQNVKVVDNGASDQATLHRSSHGRSSLQSLSSQVPSWVPKRKFENGELRPKLDAKRAKPFGETGSRRGFLNLDLNLNLATTGDCDEEDDDEDCDLEAAKLQSVLAEARSTLSDRFCALPDYAVGFNAFDFNGLAVEVVSQFGKSFAAHAASQDAALEIELGLLERIVACVWKTPGGKVAFHSWLEDVFAASVAAATRGYGDCVVEFTAEHEHGHEDIDGFASTVSMLLPHQIVFHRNSVAAAV